MVPRKLKGLLVLLFLAGALPVAAQDEALRFQRAYERIDAFVAQHMQGNRTPGLALAITSRQGLLHVATYGFADLKARTPVTPDTLFQIGSISKSFTAIALMQLREEGRFDPQAPVTTYLPWFEVKSRFEPITGHHLLSHSAGIPRDRDDIYFSPYAVFALRERETGYAPGNKFAYSNIGYQVLGKVLTEIEQRPYPEILRRRIFDPLGMKSSDPVITYETHHRLAIGYIPLYDDRPSHSSHPLVEAPKFEYYAGDGSVAATPADLAAYLRMLLNRGAAAQGRVLSEESFNRLIQPVVKMDDKSSYGYGLHSREEDAHRIIGHSGGMVGYSSMILGDLTDGLGVVVFVNGPGNPSRVAEFALKTLGAALHNQEWPALPENQSPASIENASEYGGTYQSTQDRSLTLEAQGNLLLLLRNGAAFGLERRGKDSFSVNHPDFALYALRFLRDDKNQVTEITYGPEVFSKHPPAEAKKIDYPAAWDAYSGHYRLMNPWSSNLRILVRQGKLWLVQGGSEEELVELSPGFFQVGTEETAERLRFDTLVDGRALRVTVSGLDFYRTLIP